jgi:hypothetical protein
MHLVEMGRGALRPPYVHLIVRCALWLVALTLIMSSTGPMEPSLSTGPARRVMTINPKMGVHTRLTDEVEPWKIKRTLQMVREMGTPWIVEYFPWAYAEPVPGSLDWTHADLIVDQARAQGLTVIARLGYVPDWARPSDTDLSYLDESQYGAFADFAVAFVEHFQGRIGHIVIWNEPNVSLEWGFRAPDPAGYVRLLAAVYPRVKQADPEVQVLAGALAPTLSPLGDAEAMSDVGYLTHMYQVGARPYFDALAVHAYGWHFSPDDPPAADKVNFRRTELLREIMVQYGDEAKSVYITEGGWNDHPRWTKAVHPSQRAHYTVGAYQWAQEQWPWCEAVCLWAFRYPRPAHTYQDYFTFATADFEPKPIYEVVQDYALGRMALDDR